MTLTVSVKATALVIFSKSKSKKWKLWEKDTELWKSEKKVLVDLAKLKAKKQARKDARAARKRAKK